MNPPQYRRQEIRQMRADVDRLAAQTPPVEGTLCYVAPTGGDPAMTIRLRRLHVGEPRRSGDLWLDQKNRLIPLGLRPWWQRLRGYGVVLATHSDHYRILP